MATPSAPVISNAPLASPNTLEYWWYPPTSDGGASIDDYYLTLTSQYGVLSCNVGSPGTYYKATGLSNATTYFTTIAASNANGLGATASFREFQPGSPPPRGVSTTTATAVVTSPSAALVSWTPPFGYPPVPAATIFWYVINGYTTTDSLTPVLKYTAGGQSQSNLFITGLNSSIQYYFTLRAVNCPGWSVPVSTNTIGWDNIPAFAPTQLNGITMWLDASDSNTVSLSGTNVTRWTDKVNSIPLSRASTSVTYETNIFSTRAAVYFNNGYLSSGTNALSTTKGIGNLTQFVVVRPTTAASGSYAQIAGLNYSTQNSKAVFNQSTTGIQAIVRRIVGESLASSTTYPFITLSSFILNNHINYSVTSTNQLNINGTDNILNTLTSGGLTDTTDTMFLMGNNLFNERFNGYIGEYLLYTSYITPFDRQKVEGYLGWKWGLQTNLPTSHPFYTATPTSNTVFAPTLFPGLQLWLDATQVTGYSNGQAMTSWVDKSTNAFSNTGSNGPTYQSSVLNSLPIVRFNGSTQLFNFGNVLNLSTNGISVFSVVNIQTTGNMAIIGKSVAGPGNGRWAILRDAGTLLTFINVNSPSASNITYADAATGTRIIGMTWDKSTLIAYSNANQMATLSVTEAGTLSNAFPLYVGAYPNGTGTGPLAGYYFNGDIGETLVYNRGLSIQDRQTVEGYLGWKWGLQGSLPITHPYKFNNPAVNYTTAVVVPEGLLIEFSATSYSGSGTWTNLGALGSTFSATVENGTPSKNGAGNGIVLNGSTNFTFPNISVGNAWTVTVWAKRTGSNAAGACYITQNLTGTDGNLAIYTNVTAAGANATLNQANCGFFRSNTWRNGVAVDLTSNVWYNMTYTWNGSSIVSYLNGANTGTTTPGVTSISSGQPYRIGRRWDLANYIVGEIGQVLIYNRALTTAEALQNYTATSNTYTV